MSLTIQTSVASLLKKYTYEAHAITEKTLIPKLTSIKNYDEYASVLKMFYGFFHPLEKTIRQYISKEILSDINERRNSRFIVTDLSSIGHPVQELSICNDLPKINSSLDALGSMYVLEGSTLGGRMISRMLMKNSLVRFDESNLHFFNGYQENTGSKWKYFLSVLNEYDAYADVMIASANETFTCLTKWMEQRL